MLGILPCILDRLAQLARACRARAGNAGITIDPEGVGDVLFDDAVQRGIDAQFVRHDVLEMDALRRGVAASGHVQLGRVKVAKCALEKIVSYKQSSKNWLRPIIEFGVRQDPATAGPLLPAFANGVCEALTTDTLRRRAGGRRE